VEVFYVAFGALATAFATVVGFHFGSSSGSKRKTQFQFLYGPGGQPRTPHSPGSSHVPVPTSRRPEEATQEGTTHPFEAFWVKNLSHIEHFDWEELLYKGASNERFFSNTDPAPQLYENVVPLVNTLEKIRKGFGTPVELVSIYRSPAYNRDVGGANNSRHMKFDAADFRVVGTGTGNSEKWASVAKKLRGRGEFSGGIGIYNSFVHVDTRGSNRDWDMR